MHLKLAVAATALAGTALMASPAVVVNDGGTAAPETSLMIGPGAVTCAQSPAGESSHSPANSQLIAWMLGYVSGYNSIKGGNVLEGFDLHSTMERVHQYCEANPNVRVARALDLVISGLEDRKRRVRQ